MNGNANQSFSGLNDSINAAVNFSKAGAVSGTQSPCDRAYERLVKAQNRLEEAMGELQRSLASVLREEPDANEATKPLTSVDESPQSEIHGQFLAGAQRAEAMVDGIERLMSRLTV